MKNLLIIYNAIFLLFGNVLISDIHHSSHHEHDEIHHQEKHDCHECFLIENSDNCTIDYNEVIFSKNNTDEFIFEYSNIVESYFIQIYLSRAPPIS